MKNRWKLFAAGAAIGAAVVGAVAYRKYQERYEQIDEVSDETETAAETEVEVEMIDDFDFEAVDIPEDDLQYYEVSEEVLFEE